MEDPGQSRLGLGSVRGKNAVSVRVEVRVRVMLSTIPYLGSVTHPVR